MRINALFKAILLGLLSSACTGFLFGARTVPTVVRSLNAVSDDSNDVGHIYQFTGNGPPAEFAKLFGIKPDRLRSTVSAGVKQKKAKATQTSVPVVEPVDDLEMEVLRKYGGGKKHIDGPAKYANIQPAVVGFDRPLQETKPDKRSSPVSREQMMQKWESSRTPVRGAPALVRKTTSQISQSTSRDPVVPSAGFRLRPPPPIAPEQLAKMKAKEQFLAEKAKLFEQKVKLQREKNKEMFTPFHFKHQSGADAGGTETEQGESETEDEEDSGLFSDSGFEALGITDAVILKNLESMQVLVPTQIQALAIPALLQARQNVILQAQTGSGKTLAYLLPLIDSVDTTKKQVQVLILAPSRELVQQIGQVASALFAGTLYKTVTLIGGANVQNQLKHLREDRPQIVIATPGRLAEIVFELEKLRLGSVHTVVIDEVDQMLQEPYVREVETLLQATPFTVRKSANEVVDSEVDGYAGGSAGESVPDLAAELGGATDPKVDRHLLCLVSATSHDPAVTAFADRYQTHRRASTGINTATSTDSDGGSDGSTSRPNQPAKSLKIAASGGAMLPRTITHGLISTPRMRSLEFLKRFLNARPAVQRALIFVNDPRRVEGVVKELGMAGIVAAPLHGDSSKDDRKEILMRLKDGRLKLVVATELAARGLDIPELTHVINYELPTDAEHYVHRTGRCGRAGREGLVMNFANPDTKFVVRRFGKKLGIKVLDCEIRDNKVFLKRV